jgi:putative transposase
MPAASTPPSTTARPSTITACSPRFGSVGDAYDNALAESFVDSFKTELIRDRVWRTRSQLELAIVEYVSWFNTRRLHSALGDVPPTEYASVGAAH